MPFTNMGGCELIHFFAYLLATPQISQKVEKFICNLLMKMRVRVVFSVLLGESLLLLSWGLAVHLKL